MWPHNLRARDLRREPDPRVLATRPPARAQHPRRAPQVPLLHHRHVRPPPRVPGLSEVGQPGGAQPARARGAAVRTGPGPLAREGGLPVPALRTRRSTVWQAQAPRGTAQRPLAAAGGSGRAPWWVVLGDIAAAVAGSVGCVAAGRLGLVFAALICLKGGWYSIGVLVEMC